MNFVLQTMPVSNCLAQMLPVCDISVFQDDLLGLNHKGLMRKAGDCYEKYIQLKEKVKSLETEVATLEGKKENSAVSDRQGLTGSSIEHSAVKSIPTEDVVRQFPVEYVADASGTWSTSSSPKKISHSEQHSGSVPFSMSKTSTGLSFQSPKDVDTKFCYPPALRLHVPSTSGDSSMVLHGSNGRMEGFMSSSLKSDQCPGFSGIGSSGLANRRGSSSSTDTADSGQGPKYSVQHFEGNSWPNSPDPLKPEGSRFPGLTSKSHQVLRSAMEHSKPLVQSTEVRVPLTFSVTQSLSEEMMSLSQVIPEVVPVSGRGRQASGKRGRRKRTAPDADDGKNKQSFLGKRGKLAPVARTETDTGWKLNEMRQDALLEGHGLALGLLHQGLQHPEEHGYAKPTKSNGRGRRTTKTGFYQVT